MEYPGPDLPRFDRKKLMEFLGVTEEDVARAERELEQRRRRRRRDDGGEGDSEDDEGDEASG